MSCKFQVILIRSSTVNFHMDVQFEDGVRSGNTVVEFIEIMTLFQLLCSDASQTLNSSWFEHVKSKS